MKNKKKIRLFFLKEILSYLLYIYFREVKKSVISRVFTEMSEKKVREVKPCNSPSEEKVYHTLLFRKSP